MTRAPDWQASIAQPTPWPLVAKADYYLARGTRQVGTAIPVKLLVEFDQEVAKVPFRSRNEVIVLAMRHFLDCRDADWRPAPRNSLNVTQTS